MPTVLPLSPAADIYQRDRPECVRDVVGCCSLERAPAAVDAALQCIIQMAAAPALQVLPFKLPFKLPFVCNGQSCCSLSVRPCAAMLQTVVALFLGQYTHCLDI